ncbi:Disulphide bond corrector protein DsbC [Aliiroseovarius sediminilitoris]|uniref:Disulphide bond corrector protein DsbC n=2 Tax=Aliiroseovarius sediminilitoris TaxID=1173584 RepID=A0A1I0N2L0_9RHOB|nr:Disulphide bond corrector protein DsbC [Aliiroseovarius sediminilitoris]
MYRIMSFRTVILAALVALAAFVSPGFSGNGLPPTAEEVVKIDVLPGWRNGQGQHVAALRIRLAEGWKTYWRAPGEAGIPPRLNWQGSKNLAAVQFHWPVPEVFDISGIRTIGYANELVLPMTLVPKTAGQPISLTGNVNLGVCLDVCMPMDAKISVELPAHGSGLAAPIKQALRERPDTAQEAGLQRAVCKVEPAKGGLRVTVKIEMPQIGPNEVVVVETANPSVWVSERATMRQGGALTTVADLVHNSGTPFALNRSDLRMTVLAAGRGVDIRGCTGS